MVGQNLSHYRILEKIGAGGMGEVYRAHDERLDRDVAIKVLPSGVLADDNARKRFRKEALTLSKLNHPHIAAVFDFDTQDGVDFIVMELIDGMSLAERLKTGALPEKEISEIGSQIVEAVEEAHDEGALNFAGRSDEAIQKLQETVELAPGVWLYHCILGNAYIQGKMYPEAIASCGRAIKLSRKGRLPNGAPLAHAVLAVSLAKSGELEESRGILEDLKRERERIYFAPNTPARVCAALGDADEALRWLEMGFEEHSMEMSWLKVAHNFQVLRDDPRFQDILRRMNFPE